MKLREVYIPSRKLIFDQPTIDLPAPWIVRSWEFARAICKYYEGRPPDPRLINGIREDPKTQARAKMGEVAFCLLNDLDPDRELHWTTDTPESWQWHDCYLNERRVDVKTRKGYVLRTALIWPVGKWKDYGRARFDVMALVTGDEPTFVWRGWVSKERFLAEHHLAAGGSPVPVDGTPYMMADRLDPPVAWPTIPE